MKDFNSNRAKSFWSVKTAWEIFPYRLGKKKTIRVRSAADISLIQIESNNNNIDEINTNKIIIWAQSESEINKTVAV